MGHVEYDQALGIYDIVGSFGLHITSSLIFEIAIAIAVMGGLGIIIEAIAYPTDRSQDRFEKAASWSYRRLRTCSAGEHSLISMGTRKRGQAQTPRKEE